MFNIFRKVKNTQGFVDKMYKLFNIFDSEEIDEFIYNNNVNLEISRKLREQGVTKYLCENEDYLDEIRNGSIICEGINVEEIKNMVME